MSSLKNETRELNDRKLECVNGGNAAIAVAAVIIREGIKTGELVPGYAPNHFTCVKD